MGIEEDEKEVVEEERKRRTEGGLGREGGDCREAAADFKVIQTCL